MIYVVNKKRRLIVYLINFIGIFFYPIFLLIKARRECGKKCILRKIKNKEIKIIGINCVDRLGDLLFFTPALKALKKSYPDIKIIIITNRLGAEIFKNNPYAGEIITADNFWIGQSLTGVKRFLKSFNADYAGKIKEIRRRKIDLFLEIKGDFRNIIFFNIWLGAKHTVGYALSGFGWLLDWEIGYKKGIHEIDAKLRIAEELGARATGREPEFYYSKDDEIFARDFYLKNGVQSGDSAAVFHVGGTWEPRLWPLDNFIAVGKKLKEKYGAKIILIGDSREAEKISAFTAAMPEAIKADNLAICQAAAVIKKADLFLGNDSGPLHLARSVKTPLIGIFGPEELWRVGPENSGIAVKHQFNCSPCGQVKCDKKPNCVESITVDEVCQEVEKILAKR